MSTPVNFGDIVKGIEICCWIQKKCFNPDNAADIHYAEFKQDLNGLERRLIQLRAAFENALQQTDSANQSRHALLRLEAVEMVGDFNKTLNECKVFLRDNAKLGERATPWDNLIWHTSTRVGQLRTRIKSHTYKIYLIIEPVQLQLLTDVAANTHEILDHLRRHIGIIEERQLPEIPAGIAERFNAALKSNCPIPLEDTPSLPLQEGVDVLSLHFSECTIHSTSSGIPPSLEQNLSLLKAHWLILTVEASRAFSQSRPGSLYRRIVKQIGIGVEEQYNLRKITSWTEEDFTRLEDTPFAIWPVKERTRIIDITEPGRCEEKLADVPVQSPYDVQKEGLVILRVSDKMLRTVLSRSSKDESTGVQTIDRTEKFFDLDTDGLVPLYAIAQSNQKRWNVDVNYGKGGLVAYELLSRNDTFKVQKAFTGYEAFHFAEDILCAVTHKASSGISLRKDQFNGRGEVQIWRRPPPPPGQYRNRHLSSATHGSSGDFSMQSGSTYASQNFSGFTPSVVSIMETGDGGELIVGSLPPPPLLVAFTKDESGYVMWQADISDVVDTEKKHIKKKNTWRLVFEHSKGKKFIVRRLSVTKSEMEHFDLCILVSTDNAAPPTKVTRTKPVVENLESKSLALDFQSEEKRTAFLTNFKVVVGERVTQIRHFNSARQVIETSNPIRRQTFDDGGSRRTSTSNLTIRAPTRSSTFADKDEMGGPVSPSTTRSFMVQAIT